jgi:flagellar hook-basal body complex protein FliE
MMSLSINTAVPSGSILMQLQNMQRQMNYLSEASQGAQNRAQQAAAPEQTPLVLEQDQAHTSETKVGSFAAALKDAFETVNNLQNQANNLQTRFDTGDRQVSLSDVMLATQKSSISFEAAVQVRNKLIEAYKTVSQMQI